MKYETTIIDIHQKEWIFSCEISGSLEEVEIDPSSPERFPGIGYTVGEYEVSNIAISNSKEGVGLFIGSLALMPDMFSQRVVNNVEQDALNALEEHLKLVGNYES